MSISMKHYAIDGWRRMSKQLRRMPLFSRRRNSSLVRRIQLLMILWGIAVYLVAVSGFYFASNWIIRNHFEHRATQWVADLEPVAASLLATNNAAARQALADYVRSWDEVFFLRIADADSGEALAEYAQTTTQFSDTDVLYRRFSPPGRGDEFRSVGGGLQLVRQDDFLRVVAPLPRLAGSTAYLEMGIDVTPYVKRILDYVFTGTLIITCMFVIGAVAGRALIKQSLRSLMSLREPLARLADGDTSVRVGRYQDEEIDAISRALNTTIRAIRERDQELRRLANCDDLTGLMNKRSFNQMLSLECERVRVTQHVSALFFIDLDQFKYINDTFGHSAGDRLLMQVADLLRERMREGDVVARLGGDEFAVLARGASADAANEIARSLIAAMRELLFIEQGKALHVHCSIGIALIEGGRYSAEEVFSHADMACYAAKSRGRDCFFRYEDAADAEEKIDAGWSRRISRALTQNQFVLHYQPVYALADGSVAFHEALVRMRTEQHGVVLPNLFLPAAERFGLMVDIDCWVLRSAMARAADEARCGRRVVLSVNLSTQTLVLPELVATVLDYQQRFGVSGDQFIFELQERSAVTQLMAAQQTMQQLRDRGFRFAIDDFGGGGSPWSYLKQAPVDMVKIQGELIERLGGDPVDGVLVKSMIEVAAACGKQVIAEYVSDARALELLGSLGADYVQGHFLASPARGLAAAGSNLQAKGELVTPAGACWKL